MERTTNFNAGPAALPLDVLQKAQKEFVNFNDTEHVRHGAVPPEQRI